MGLPASSKPPRSVQPRDKVILVVDDEETNCELLASILEAEGYRVVIATTGADALEHVRKGAVDLVLLDVMLPEMDGIQVCKRIRRDLGDATLPIVFITALTDRDSRVRGKRAGGDDFLAKPIDTLELLTRVENLLHVRELHMLRESQRLRLERELAALTQKLAHIERLTTVGSLAGSVGHELNNIASVHAGTLQLMRDAAERGVAIPERAFARMERVGKHIEEHARRLLHIASPNSPERAMLDFGVVVRESMELVRATRRSRGANLVHESVPLGAMVVMNRSEAEQIVLNLVLNACDAVNAAGRSGGHVWVSLEWSDDGKQIRLIVEDDGPGVPAEALDRAFEPFVSTKPNGTGLGLSVVRQIASTEGGSAALMNRPEGGARAVVSLPTAGPKPPRTPRSMVVVRDD